MNGVNPRARQGRHLDLSGGGPNMIAISVSQTGLFPGSRPVTVEKVELCLK